MIVIVLNGYPRSGKDSFINEARFTYKVVSISTIDRCVDVATMLEWDGVKDNKSRAMLSDLKKWYVKHFDGPYKDITREIENYRNVNYNGFFFVTSRENEEIERFRNYCESKNIPFYYIFVDREESVGQYGNSSDDEVLTNHKPDYIIPNNDSLEDFKNRTITLLKMIKKENF